MSYPVVEIVESEVEGNITINIQFDHGTVTIHAHNDVTQSIHVLPDKEISFALNNNEYSYDGEYVKRIYKILDSMKKEND